MNKLSKPLSSALLAGSAFLSLPALAAHASALAELTSVGYELIDLAPDDGVTPALFVDTERVTGYTNLTLPDFQTLLQQQGQVQTKSSHVSGFSLTDVTASGQRSEVAFHADPGGGWATSRTLNQLTFELTANTAIRFDMRGALSAEPGFGPGSAQAYLQGWFYSVSNGVTERPSFDYVQSISDGTRNFALGAYYETGNYTGGGTIYYGLATDLTFAAAPVPEPATWGVLGLGLLVVGTAARRRPARSH